MNKPIGIIVLATTLLFAASALAAPHGPRQGPGQERGGDHGMQMIEGLAKSVRQLDLSEDQATVIHDELDGLREIVKPLAKEMHEGRRELRELITAPAYDHDAAAAIAEQQGRLTTEIMLAASGAAATVLAQLDADQRAELQTIREERSMHRKLHREMSRERRRDRRGEAAQDAPGGN